ncbi:hypothetical protein [Saccharopolyspora cebuensis]|uniref:Uncharacterized protein n=1 Tax=Saccharopolyspora cebuensis TaxID=418759 RepID=A0ABV4CLX0_9PSEU
MTTDDRGDELEAVKRQAALIAETRALVESQVEDLKALLPAAKATGRWSSNEIARAASGGMARIRVLKEIGDDEVLGKAQKALQSWPTNLFELRFRNPNLFISFCRPDLEKGSAEAHELAAELLDQLKKHDLWIVCEQDGKNPARGLAEGRTCAVVTKETMTARRYLTP